MEDNEHMRVNIPLGAHFFKTGHLVKLQGQSVELCLMLHQQAM